MFETHCPICLSSARQLKATYHMRHFDCPNCGRIDLSDTAYEMAKTQLPAEKQKALERARKDAGGDSVPVIMSDHFDDIS